MFSLAFNKVETDKTFQVPAFTAKDAISQPYRYAITTLVPLAATIEYLDNWVDQPASFTINLPYSSKSTQQIHGVVTGYRLMGQPSDAFSLDHLNDQVKQLQLVEVILEPRLVNLAAAKRNRLFSAQSTVDIIRSILRDYDLKEDKDFVIACNEKSYRHWHYKLSYQQNDFAFLSYLLEQEGLSYFFVQEKGYEKVVFTDNLTSLAGIVDINHHQAVFQAVDGTVVTDARQLVYSVQQREKVVPRSFCLQTEHMDLPDTLIRADYPQNQKEYDTALPDIHYHNELLTDFTIEEDLAKARIKLFDLRRALHEATLQKSDNQQDLQQQIEKQLVEIDEITQKLKASLTEKAQYLIERRAQAYKVLAKQYKASSNLIGLFAGSYLAVKGHHQQDLNKTYRVMSIEHQGIDPQWQQVSQPLIYANHIILLDEHVPFVPFLTKNSYKMPNFIKGFIVGKSQDAQDKNQNSSVAATELPADSSVAIDDFGRYKVKLVLDSEPVYIDLPMGQPYAGVYQGWHLPLPVGTEVIVQFIYGDPDRPVISTALPDLSRSSVVSPDKRQSQLVTASGHSLRADKQKDVASLALINKQKLVNISLNQRLSNPSVETNSESKAINRPEASLNIDAYGQYYRKADQGDYQLYLSDKEKQSISAKLQDKKINLAQVMVENLAKGNLPGALSENSEASSDNKTIDDNKIAEFSYVAGNQVSLIGGDKFYQAQDSVEEHYGRKLTINLPENMTLEGYRDEVKKLKNK